MIIVRELSTWHPPENGAIVCLGIFDGVHLGHRHVLEETVQWARSRNAAAGVVTFDTKPPSLAARTAPPLLLSVEHRVQLLRRIGLDFAVLLRFSDALSNMTAETFVSSILCDGIGVRGIVVGFDQRFGKDRTGDIALLRQLGQTHDFDVRQTPPARVLGDIVSSTRIRDAIRSGRLAEAAMMLGRPVTCRGAATKNEETSRKTGYPTFALDLHHEVRPPCGVYAVHVTGAGADVLALCNISPRVHAEHSEFSDVDECVVEICFAALPEGIEGQEIDLGFLGLVREELRFAGAEDMRSRIRRDFEELEALRETWSGPSRPTPETR